MGRPGGLPHSVNQQLRKLEPEIQTAVAGRIDAELAQRSQSGALVYFIVCLTLAVATPYYTDHPLLLTGVAGAMLVLGAGRLAAGRRFSCQTSPGLRTLLIASIYGSFAVWGVFCAWTIHLYRGEWTAMFVLLATAALAGGATTSLAPHPSLALQCLALLVGPTVVSAILVGDTRHWALAFLAGLYLAFLLAQARGNWQAFLSLCAVAEREKLRGSTERKQAEQQRATLVAAIEQAAEEIMITDVDGNIVYCNPSFEQITGWPKQEAIGQNPRILRSGKHDSEFFRNLWETLLGGGVWTGRMTNSRKDNTLYETEGTISAIRDASGRITGFVSARHDVTEMVRLEGQLRQAQKMESIGRLAGGVAHDFNNLLTVISGYSDLLLRDLQSPSNLREYVSEIRRAAGNASSLTQQLLTFSRRQIIKPQPMDLNQVVSDIERLVQRLVGEDIEVITVLDAALGTVRMDADQMNQILMNLAANARDAMPHGGRLTLLTSNVEFRTGIGASATSGHAVLLTVIDTGVGMTEETRQQIFEPFFTTKKKGRGTGLGLSTVYGIVEQNGGRIEVQSEPGKGTTFRVYLPRLEEARPVVERPTIAGMSLGGSETILVVEDQTEIRTLMSQVLQSYGFAVLSATHGEEALRRAREHSGTIDLLLTDVIMPGMTGKELADRLSQSRPAMKVLYTSGYSGEVIAHRGVLDAGVAYLPKPFTPEALALKVRSVLGPAGDRGADA